VVTHKAEVFIFRVLANKVLGRIARKSVNANLFSPIKILSTAYVLCSLRLLMLKKKQKVKTEHLSEKLQKINQNSR